MSQNHLKTLTVTNPINRCPTVIVPAHELDRFERECVRWPHGGCHSRFELFRSDAEIGHVAQDANDIFVGESIVPHRKRDADIGRVDLDVIVNGAHCDF